MVPDTETSIEVIFFYSFQINHLLHWNRDENIKCKAYLLNLGSLNVHNSL